MFRLMKRLGRYSVFIFPGYMGRFLGVEKSVAVSRFQGVFPNSKIFWAQSDYTKWGTQEGFHKNEMDRVTKFVNANSSQRNFFVSSSIGSMLGMSVASRASCSVFLGFSPIIDPSNVENFRKRNSDYLEKEFVNTAQKIVPSTSYRFYCDPRNTSENVHSCEQLAHIKMLPNVSVVEMELRWGPKKRGFVASDVFPKALTRSLG